MSYQRPSLIYLKLYWTRGLIDVMNGGVMLEGFVAVCHFDRGKMCFGFSGVAQG